MNSNEPRVAILGAGRIGMFHAENIVNNVSGLTLKAIADPVPEVGERASERLDVEVEEDWRVVVQDPGIDAVVIASPTDYHAEQIVGAIEAGKHIFCEKPIARDLPSIDELLARVEERGLKFQTGFNRRFDHNFGALRSRVANGEIGDLWMVKITSRDPEPPPLSYLMDSGGLFFDMAIHDFDMARFLVGAEVAEVTARGSALVGPETSKADDIDTAVTILQFENGVMGHMWISAEMPAPSLPSSEVSFSYSQPCYNTAQLRCAATQLEEIHRYFLGENLCRSPIFVMSHLPIFPSPKTLPRCIRRWPRSRRSLVAPIR